MHNAIRSTRSEAHAHGDREIPLARVTEDVRVPALEDDAEAAEREIVSEPPIQSEVPVAVRVTEVVRVVRAVVASAAGEIEAAIGARRAEVEHAVERDSEHPMLRVVVEDVVVPWQLGEASLHAKCYWCEGLMHP